MSDKGLSNFIAMYPSDKRPHLYASGAAQKNEIRTVDWTMRWSARVKYTAFSQTQSAKAAEPTALEPEPRGSVVHDVDLTLDDTTDHQACGSRTLSARHIMPTELASASLHHGSMPPKRTVCYQQREWQHAHFLGNTLYHAHSGVMEI